MIRRANPIIVLGVLVLVLVFLFLGVQAKEESIKQGSIELAKYEAKAKMLQELKRGWNQKNIASKLSSLTSSPALKSNSKINRLSDKIVMSIGGIDKAQADKIIKDFLNEPFDIRKFQIKRVSQDSVEIQLEVAL